MDPRRILIAVSGGIAAYKIPELARALIRSGHSVRCALTPRPGVDLRPQVFDAVRRNNWPMRELTSSRHTLEDVFVHITGADNEDSF